MKKNDRLPLVDLHPLTWKSFHQGHPWVLKDSYTARFPPSPFLQAKDYILLHDPHHPQIKARIWCQIPSKESWDPSSFENEFWKRLKKAVHKRKRLLQERQNIYLCFGEADHLPGFQLLKLDRYYFIFLYSHFWKHSQSMIIKGLKSIIPEQEGGLFLQYRDHQQSKEKIYIPFSDKVEPERFLVEEFGVKYLIKSKDFYDLGLYTDMASIRKDLSSYFDSTSRVLNLFSYTGAWSLYPLSLGADHVTSVDLSKKYMNWLEFNSKLNKIDQNKLTNLTLPVEESLKKLRAQTKLFDVILSDPPSFSSDGKNQEKALDSYHTTLPLMNQVRHPKGKIILFLNTHKIKQQKFEDQIKKIITQKNLKLSMAKRLHMSEDCYGPKGFPEGNYLKGLVLS